MAEFMRNTDTFAWAMENDPVLRSTVVLVALLETAPSYDVVVDRFDRISRAVPLFRQRIVPNPPPAPPRWEVDPDFDLGYHLRRVVAPPPGDLDAVLAMARRAQMDQFDHARPLWEVTLVEGLAGGGAALVCKVHHSLADGIGALQIGRILFDLSEQPQAVGPAPPEPQPDRAGSLRPARDLVRYQAGLAAAAARTGLRAAPAALGAARRPVHAAEEAALTAASVYRLVRPINRTGSPIMKRRGLVRQLVVHEVPLPVLREAAHRADARVNDAFLAGVTGGLRRYHTRHGVALGDLHVTMPVSIRRPQDPVGGNRITLMRFDLPAGVWDPLERTRLIHHRTEAIRRERSLPHTQLVAGALNLVPRAYLSAILRHVDFLASDVPGLPAPVFVGGAAVRALYPFGPTIGAAVNVTLMSYVDVGGIGVSIDTAAIPDTDAFEECLRDGFDEVLALTGGTPRMPHQRSRTGRAAGEGDAHHPATPPATPPGHRRRAE